MRVCAPVYECVTFLSPIVFQSAEDINMLIASPYLELQLESHLHTDVHERYSGKKHMN